MVTHFNDFITNTFPLTKIPINGFNCSRAGESTCRDRTWDAHSMINRLLTAVLTAINMLTRRCPDKVVRLSCHFYFGNKFPASKVLIEDRICSDTGARVKSRRRLGTMLEVTRDSDLYRRGKRPRKKWPTTGERNSYNYRFPPLQLKESFVNLVEQYREI